MEELGDHLHIHLEGVVPQPNHKTRDRGRSRRTRDVENTEQVGILPQPKDGSHYELRDLETGEVEIVLVQSGSEFTGNLPSSAGDRSPRHKLHQTNGDPLLKQQNANNRRFWGKATQDADRVDTRNRTLKRGTTADKLAAINAANRQFYKRGK